jgi:hypothetical protein
MPDIPAVTQAAQIPDSVYTILGIIILTNLGVIVTVIGAAFRLVYKWAVLETTTKALHRRVDALEKSKHPADNDGDQDDL